MSGSAGYVESWSAAGTRFVAACSGTFDPFTPGHRDLVARTRVMFDWVIVLLAANADKQPAAEAMANNAEASRSVWPIGREGRQMMGVRSEVGVDDATNTVPDGRAPVHR
ncbi:adenylyltransferase/cytidyltransferase family protein [Micromonospora zamorensis]|uniref:adenylyltransferase/cytidyltransferase family protein n=1 Tax=Micromonospora zamorensis TaxID=709883 RepID=UPI003677EA3C